MVTFPTSLRKLFCDRTLISYDPSSVCDSVMSIIIGDIISSIDMESLAVTLNLEGSYATLHDHSLGDEILRQAGVESMITSVLNYKSISDSFEGNDYLVSGELATAMSTKFVSVLAKKVDSKEYLPLARRLLASKMKCTEWWKDNSERISLAMHTNRKKMRDIQKVQDI